MSFTTLTEKPNGEISIWAYREAKYFFIELKDNSIPFNPLVREEIDEKPADLESAKVGGLGISFMRRIFDEMTYHFGRDGDLFCNHLKLSIVTASEVNKAIAAFPAENDKIAVDMTAMQRFREK